MASTSAILSRVRGREIDNSFLDRSLLDVAVKSKTSAFAWKGQFTPGLPELLLSAYDNGRGLIFDPFAGSGTTILEAAFSSRPAVGVEVNPAAYTLARVVESAKFVGAERQDLITGMCDLVRPLTLAAPGTLFDEPEMERSSLTRRLATLARTSSPEVSPLLEAVLLLSMRNEKVASAERIEKALGSVRQVAEMLPDTPVESEVKLGDARYSGLASHSVGTTITSPPYINVINYHQNYRPAIELLGWEVLPAARSEIGSNRKHRANRFLTVIQYAQDMFLALREIVRVSQDGAIAVIVVGRESRVRGVPFANGEIISVLGEMVPSLEFVRWQERRFTNRYGTSIYEDLVTFRVAKRTHHDASPAISAEHVGREVGIAFLEDSLSVGVADAYGVPDEVELDMKDALSSADTVLPSPAAVAPRR